MSNIINSGRFDSPEAKAKVEAESKKKATYDESTENNRVVEDPIEHQYIQSALQGILSGMAPIVLLQSHLGYGFGNVIEHANLVGKAAYKRATTGVNLPTQQAPVIVQAGQMPS